jgi:transcriptional regulator with XRE-family HTH domain
MSDLPVLYHRIGARIAYHRRGLGWNQHHLAEKVGLTRTSITNIEQGLQGVRIDTLYRIALTMNIAIDNFLPQAEKPADYAGWLEKYEEESPKALLLSAIDKFQGDKAGPITPEEAAVVRKLAKLIQGSGKRSAAIQEQGKNNGQ